MTAVYVMIGLVFTLGVFAIWLISRKPPDVKKLMKKYSDDGT